MKPLTIVVLFKFTPDVNQLEAHPSTRAPELARAPLRINDFDENAIEAAVQLKERHGGRVVGLTLAAREPPRDLLLRVLAMGVDRVALVTDPAADAFDGLEVATRLAAAIAPACALDGGGRPDLVLCGDASVDSLSGETGPRVAEELELPALTAATRIELVDGRLVVERTLEREIETVEAELPLVVSVGMEINRPRLPTVLQIMGAGRKPVAPLSTAPARRAAPPPRTESVRAPASARRRVVVEGDGVEELAARLLRHLNEAGEITT